MEKISLQMFVLLNYFTELKKILIKVLLAVEHLFILLYRDLFKDNERMVL